MPTPPRAVAIGSCLSNLTIANLINDFGFEQALCVHHMRSDRFVDIVVERRAEMIPAAFLDRFLQVKPEFDGTAQDFLRNQYPQTMGFFTLAPPDGGEDFVRCMTDQAYDVVLIDNFMDVAAKLMHCTTMAEFAGRPLFLNPHFYSNEAEINANFAFGEFLEPEQSAANTLAIVRWVRALQPQARIVVLCFHTCSSLDNPDRFRRADGFYPAFARLAASEDVVIVPPVNVPPALQAEGDWAHLKPSVYRGIAGQVYLRTVST